MRRHLLLERASASASADEAAAAAAAECAPEKRRKARICGRYDDMKILWLCMCERRSSPSSFTSPTFSVCVTALSGFQTLTSAFARVLDLLGRSLDPKSESEITFEWSRKEKRREGREEGFTLPHSNSVLERARALFLHLSMQNCWRTINAPPMKFDSGKYDNINKW